MKKTLLLTILLGHTASINADNIADLYNSIKIHKDGGYTLIKKKGVYMANYCEEDQPFDLDLKNGYFRIEDDCPGGGVWIHEVGLFRDLEKVPYIAINNISASEGLVDEATLNLYKQVAENKWALADLGLKINFDLFYEKPEKRKKRSPKIVMAVPREGTDLRVFLIAFGSRSWKGFLPLTAEEVDKIEPLGRLICDEVILGWDNKNGKFFLKQRCLKGKCTSVK